MKSVIVYSTPTCSYCKKLKEWFRDKNIPFEDINVADNEKAAKKMVEESGQFGVPVWKVVEDGKVKRIAIGYDINELEEEFI